MTALNVVWKRAAGIAANGGHARSFIIVSVVWIAITAPLFWKPLPYLDDELPFLGASLPAPDPAAINLWDPINLWDHVNTDCREVWGFSPKQHDQNYSVCVDRVKEQIEDKISMTRFWQIAAWLAIVLLVPVFLPILLFGIMVVAQWVKDGYDTKPPRADRYT